MKPIGQNIVIKTVDEEIRTSSGLLLSADDANQMRYKRGTVIAPGTDVVSISKDDDIYDSANPPIHGDSESETSHGSPTCFPALFPTAPSMVLLRGIRDG